MEQSEVIIVSKTKANNAGTLACVGGVLSGAFRSVRLLPPDSRYRFNPVGYYEIGQVWDIGYEEVECIPPHIEDIHVTHRSAAPKRVLDRTSLYQFISENLNVYQGSLQSLFEGHLQQDNNRKRYVPASGPHPSFSTCFWFADRDLVLTPFEGSKDYEYGTFPNSLKVKYVGFNPSLPKTLPAGSLLRLSLAGPHKWEGIDEERCYLMLSGWY